MWVLSSLQRAGLQDTPGQARSVALSAARGECTSFQVVLQAPSGGLHNANATASDLAGSAGVIASSNLTFYREYFVRVMPGSPDQQGANRPSGPGWYPDALIPFVDPETGRPPSGGNIPSAPFDVTPGSNQPLWIDVCVPVNAKPGAYAGNVSVTAGEGEFDVPVTLTVWNFKLPVSPSLKSTLIYWNQNHPQAAIMELLRNRLMPERVNPASESTLRQHGLTMTETGLWSGADNTNCVMGRTPSVYEFQQAAARHDPNVSLFNYTADEINHCPHLFPQLMAWASNMHQAGIRNMVVMTPTPELFDDGQGNGRSAVDIWVVLPKNFTVGNDYIQQALAKGDEVWSYNALVQDTFSPKWLIDYDPINFRIQAGFVSESLGLTGILYWRIDRWTPDPWSDVNNTGDFNGQNYPGDGMLVYPGARAGLIGVAPSMRLKQLRDGAQDFEYVEILKQLGQKDWALKQARSIGADWSHWTRDGMALLTVRQQMGAKIDALSSGP